MLLLVYTNKDEVFMHNELLKIGPLTIHGYGLMIAIGIIAAYYVAEYRAKKRELDPNPLFDCVVITIVCGIGGAKVLYWITMWKEIMADPSLLKNIGDGFVVYGGIIGGVVGGLIYLKWKKLDALAYFDLIAPELALAQGFGRLGCFLAGCCYGLEMDTPISIVFTHSDFAPNNVPLIPTQLISSGLDFLNFALLIYLGTKIKKKGALGCVYLLTYSIGRFFLEYLRGDLIRGSVGMFSTSQFISLGMFAIVCTALFLLTSNKKTDNI